MTSDGYGSTCNAFGFVMVGDEELHTPAIGPSVLDANAVGVGIVHTTSPHYSFVDFSRVTLSLDGTLIATTGDVPFDSVATPGNLNQRLDIPAGSFTSGTHTITAHFLAWNHVDGPGTPLVDLTDEQDIIVTLLSVDPLTGAAPLAVTLSGTFPFALPIEDGS